MSALRRGVAAVRRWRWWPVAAALTVGVIVAVVVRIVGGGLQAYATASLWVVVLVLVLAVIVGAVIAAQLATRAAVERANARALAAVPATGRGAVGAPAPRSAGRERPGSSRMATARLTRWRRTPRTGMTTRPDGLRIAGS